MTGPSSKRKKLIRERIFNLNKRFNVSEVSIKSDAGHLAHRQVKMSRFSTHVWHTTSQHQMNRHLQFDFM